MTMVSMDQYLENRGFDVKRKYDPSIRKYKFTISKDDCTLSMLFEYPATGDAAVRDKKQREFLEEMIARFKRDFEDEESLYPKLLTIDDMVKVLERHNITVSVHTQPNSIGKAETYFTMFRKGRTLSRVLYEYNIGGLKEIQQFRRHFIEEIVEAFDCEERREKELKYKTIDLDIRELYPETMIARDIRLKDLEPKTLYISTAGCRPHTVFEDFIRAKEKEMSNKINWKVKNITVDNRERTPILNAELEGTIIGACTGNVMDISNEIRDRLNAPEKSEEEYLRYCAADVAITKSFYSRFGTTKLPAIEKVIFNNPATIVIWKDGSKTVVKVQSNELFDPEKGLAMAITKKALGNEGNYFETIKKHVTEYQDSVPVKKLTVDISVENAFKYATDNIKKFAESLNKKRKEEEEHSKQWTACQRLHNALGDKKATKADLKLAMEEAIKYLETNKGSDT